MKRAIIAAVTATTLAVAGCASQAEPAEPAPPGVPSHPSPSQSQGNDRGNRVYEVGEVVELQGDKGYVYAKMKVTSLTVQECVDDLTGDRISPLVMEIVVTTSKDARKQELVNVVTQSDMSIYNKATGVTKPNYSHDSPDEMACMGEFDPMPTSMDPGSKYEGAIAFSNTPDHGAVIFDPHSPALGMEWRF